MQLSKKALAISASLTLKITARAKDMRAMGLNVVSFGAGEPDFDTPQHIKDAAIEAIKLGMTKYTPSSGTFELKHAVCEHLKKLNKLHYDLSQIVVSNGAKHSLFNAFQAILNPKDEVIVISPYWLSYPEMIKMAGGVPVYVQAEESNDFHPTAKAVRAAVTEKTKAIIINDPNNPCGCIYSQELLTEIAGIAREFDFFIISDEIYSELVYDSHKHTSIASVSEDAFERTIVINGLSKTYAMTGWRIGYSASTVEVADVMSAVQSHETSNPNSIAQYAGTEALVGSQEEIRKMRTEFNHRRKLMVKKINEINGLHCNLPMGAFYVMVNISDFKGRKINGDVVETSVDFAEKLLEEQLTAVIPGAAFGADDFIRLSYATSRECIEEGIDRLAAFTKMFDPIG